MQLLAHGLISNTDLGVCYVCVGEVVKVDCWEDRPTTWPSFGMRVLIKLGLVRVCAFVYANSKPRSGAGAVREVGRVLFISRLRLMCKCAKSDCIIMQMLPLGAQYSLMNYSHKDGD